jgi:hypothetical protein
MAWYLIKHRDLMASGEFETLNKESARGLRVMLG